MPNLPLAGVEAVVLGMSAFNANSKTVQSHLQQMGAAAFYLERSSKSAFSGVEASFAGMATAVGVSAGIAVSALTALGVAAIVTSQKYGQAMAFIGAVSESTSGQMALLDKAQLSLARTTTTSAQELTVISAELAKTGFSAEQLAGGVLKAVNALVVASAGELKAADAALLAQVSIAGFGAAAAKAGEDVSDFADRAANVATAAVQTSALSFTGYSQTLALAGGAAVNAGFSIEEFGATVATVAQTIKSGSQVGTGLAQMFVSLQAPSKAGVEAINKYGLSLYDATGKVRPAIDVIRSLTEAFGPAAIASGKITQQERDRALADIFTTRSTRTVIALVNEGTDAWLKYLSATQTLKASDLAAAVLAPTAAQIKILRNNVEALGIAFGTGLDPYIHAATSSLLLFMQSIDIDRVRGLGTVVGQDLYNAFANAGNIIDQSVLPALNDLGSRFSEIGSAIDTLTGVENTASRATELLANTATMLATVALKTVIGSLNIGSAALHTFAQWVVNNNAAINGFIQNALTALVAAYSVVQRATQQTIQWLANLFSAIDTSQMHFGIMRSVIVVTAALMIAWGKVIAEVATNTVTGLVEIVQAFIAWRNDIDTSQKGATFVLGQFLRDTGNIFDKLAQGIIIIANLPAYVVLAWAENWGNLRGIVGQTMSAVLDIFNKFLDALSFVPMFAPAVGEARAVIGFFQGVQRYAVQVSNAMDAAGATAKAAFSAMQQGGANLQSTLSNVVTTIQDVKLPELHNFAADLDAVNAAAVSAADGIRETVQAAQELAMPDTGEEGVEPGIMPDSKAAEEQQKLADKIAELWRDFDKEIAQENKKVTDDIARATREASQAMDAAITRATKDIAKATQDAQDQLDDMASDRAIREDADKRKQALDDRLKQEEDARSINLANLEASHQRELEDNQHRLDLERQQREDAFTKQLADAALARDRLREDQDRSSDASNRDLEQFYKDQQEIAAKALKARQKVLEDELHNQQDQAEQALKQDQDKREDALDARYDELKRELDREQEEQQRAFDKQQQALKDALKAQQDAREDALKAQFDAEDRARKDARDLEKIISQDTADKAKAQGEYNDEIAKGVKQTIAQARLDKKIQDINEKTEEAKRKLAEAQEDRTEDLKAEADQQKRLQELHNAFAQEDITLEEQIDLAKVALRDKLAQQDLELQKKHEEDVKNLRLTFERETNALKADYEKKFNEQKATFDQQAADLEAQQERDLKAYVEQLDKDALKRKREREGEDRAYAKGQEIALRDFNAAEDEKALKAKRDLEDTERNRRIKLDADEEAFRRSQANARAALEKQLADEEYDRRVKRIQEEYDARVKEINDALEEERKRIHDGLDDQITDYNTHLAERIASLRANYLDKLDDIMRDGGDALAGAADAFKQHMEQGLTALQNHADDLLATLQKVASVSVTIGGGTLSPGGGTGGGTTGAGGGTAAGGHAGAATTAVSGLPGGLYASGPGNVVYDRATNEGLWFFRRKTDPIPDWGADAENWFLRGDTKTGVLDRFFSLAPGDQSAWQAINQLIRLRNEGWVSPASGQPGRLYNLWAAGNIGALPTGRALQYGGTVPGPYGSRQWVMAHGGERFEGVGLQAMQMAAVRAAESMLSRGIGGASTVNNNYNYEVNANYGKTQEAGSVARDLRALVALTSS